MKNRFVPVAIIFVLFVPAFLLLLYILLPFPDPDFKHSLDRSTIITDRNGKVLRYMSTGKIADKMYSVSDISPYLRGAVIATEDRRFFYHDGLDIIALGRAFSANLKAKSLEQGASTLSQQLAALLFDIPPTPIGKIKKIIIGFKLERHLSKTRILELYLNRAPFGDNYYGVAAASRSFFHREPSDLSAAQAAVLASALQNPFIYSPRIFPENTLKRRKLVLKAMQREGYINDELYKTALAEEVEIYPIETDFEAPHFCDYIASSYEKNAMRHYKLIRTTIDLALQKKAQAILSSVISGLAEKNVTNGAVVILKNDTGEIMAMIGSVDYKGKAGQVNAALSLRPPGSALKPFTYASALEKRVLSASDIIPDLTFESVEEGGLYIPKNYDGILHGPVTARTALACSYNIPAVRVLEKIGVEYLFSKLHDLGFAYMDKPPSYYGLGLTLGDAPVTLLELTRAYTVFSRGGKLSSVRSIISAEDEKGRLITPDQKPDYEVFSPEVSYIIFDILTDNNARTPAFGAYSSLRLPFQCAVKTGTSKSFRDNWTVGTSRDYTVGVWVGNFDNSKMKGISGVTGAAPVFKKIMLMLAGSEKPGNISRPQSIVSCNVCSSSGLLSDELCGWKQYTEIYKEGTQPYKTCDVHRKLKIDKRTGKIVDQKLSGKYITEKVFEVYPPLYHHWMRENGLEIPSLVSSSNETFQIVSPVGGESYRIDPVLRREYQKITFKAVSDNTQDLIEWFLNGKKIGESKTPFILEWPLEKGVFTLRATQSGKSSQCSFNVY